MDIKLKEVEIEKLEYLKILKGLYELPFQVGKNLLVDFLKGDYKNKSVTNNKLDQLQNFGTLLWQKEKIHSEIERLIQNGLIELTTSDYNKFVKVLNLTAKGMLEIKNPSLFEKQLNGKVDFRNSKITEEEKKIFHELKNFLWKYNDDQKKAIISKAKEILCIAGAGSGKTTVLTKRIEFLIKYRGVEPNKILAITFTRKARREMERRLNILGVSEVNVHTFNSFCERVLKKYGNLIYGRQIRLLDYPDKILAMNLALGNLGLDMEEAIIRYFSPQQRKFKSRTELSNSFMNDCFGVLDYFKIKSKEDYEFYKDAEEKHKKSAKMIYDIIQYLKEHMEIQGLRDYTDQMIDAIGFLKNNINFIPEFEHILVDEYQDVNSTQIELLNLLKPKNIFTVGDPRQSIFGWRGSSIEHILNFEKIYPSCEVIHLKENYRSSKKIVNFINNSIKSMGLPDLNCGKEKKSTIKIIDFDSEESEMIFIVDQITNSEIPIDNIFVLARTNRQLTELSRILKLKKVPHVLKTDEIRRPIDENPGELTLATIHAIKGLEAKKVILIGCNEQNFPCKASDHPAIEMIKTDNYDKLEEEKRLFYVALSRSKEHLILTYSGKRPTFFINEEMKRMVD